MTNAAITTGTFKVLSVAHQRMDIHGFKVQPGMVICQASKHHDVLFILISTDCNDSDYAYGYIIANGKFYRCNTIKCCQFDGIRDAFLAHDRMAFAEACKIAKAITEPAMAQSTLHLTDVAPGLRSCDGGEYGFYTHLEPTRVPGVFWEWTTCSCDFDDCGTTGYAGGSYAVYSKEELQSAIAKSDAIALAGSLYD